MQRAIDGVAGEGSLPWPGTMPARAASTSSVRSARRQTFIILGGAIWALPVTILMYRALPWKTFKIAVAASVRTSAIVFLLVGTATAFGHLLALYRLPDHLTDAMLAISSNRSR